jgi:hypothetical protein
MLWPLQQRIFYNNNNNNNNNMNMKHVIGEVQLHVKVEASP